MTPAIAEVDELWAAVGDPTRRRVLDVLLDRGEATATVVAGELPVTRQAVAKHLAVLDRAGLVEGRRQRARDALRGAAGAARRGGAVDGRGGRGVGHAPARDQADRRGGRRRPATAGPNTKGDAMTAHTVGTREEWLAARRELLAAEKELHAPRDELARRRRELPWVPVEKDVRLRHRGRARDARRAVRRPLAADRLPLHVRPGLRGGMPELLGDRRRVQRRRPAPRPPRRRDDAVRVAGPAREAAGLPASGWAGRSPGRPRQDSDFNYDFADVAHGGGAARRRLQLRALRRHRPRRRPAPVRTRRGARRD